LEEEEVGDFGEVGLAGVKKALEDAEVDEGSGFERVGDSSRIPRSCGPMRMPSVWIGVRRGAH
jgi:hypothetical protein